MTVKRRVLGAFGIRSVEAARVAWLVTHSLFIGLFSAFFLTTANALFLDRFEITYLPLAYIAAAIVGYVAVMLFSRLEKMVSIKRLLIINLSSLLIITGGFWFLTLTTENQWVIFFMFVWVGPAFSLVSLGYWALAVRLFDLRQGKRLFGLVGAGEEVSTVVCLFSVPLLVGLLGGPLHLLLVAVVGLVGCLVAVAAITLKFGDALGIHRMASSGAEEDRRSGLADLVRNRYFLLMATLVIFLSLGNYIVDFSFLSEVRLKFQGPGQIAQFIGLFFGVAKVLELIMKAFLSGRLIGQFGLKFGLMVLPVLLLTCGVFAIAIGSLGLAATHFFVLVALSKLLFVVTRTSMFEPSFRVFYQPVRGVDRLSFQAHVEGSAKQLATGVVGVALLLFSRSGSFDALNLFYALVPVLVAWIVANQLAYRDYRSKLMDSLTARERKEEVKKPFDLLKPQLFSGSPRDHAVGLYLLERIDPSDLEPALAGMLSDSSPAVRASALDCIGRKRLLDLMEKASVCAQDSDPKVQATARETEARLRQSRELAADPDRIGELVRSSEPEDRALAANAIGRGTGNHAGRLSVLLYDREREVLRSALMAAGRTGNPEFWPQIIAHLASPAFAPSAEWALVDLGEPVLGEIDRNFNKAEQDPSVRLRMLKIYEGIGGKTARSLLVSKLGFPDPNVRRQAVIALSRLGYRAGPGEVALVERAIESLVGLVAWNMSALLDLGEDAALVRLRAALEEEIEGYRSRLFLLLSLLYDPWAIGLVKENIESGSSGATAYALEIMDILTSAELKPLVFPLLEDLTYPQVLKRLDGTFPRQRLDRLERLSAIVNREYDKIGTWTRTCGVEATGQVVSTIVPDLLASLHHPNPIIHEVAARSIVARDLEAYFRQRKKLPYDIGERLDRVIGPDGELVNWESRSIFGRVELLRRIASFSTLSSEALVKLAAASEERVLGPGRRLPTPKEPRDSVYVFLDGDVAFAEGATPEMGSNLPPLSLIAFGPGGAPLEVRETSRFIRLDPQQLFELAAEYVELIPVLVRAEKQLCQVEGESREVADEPSHEPPQLSHQQA